MLKGRMIVFRQDVAGGRLDFVAFENLIIRIRMKNHVRTRQRREAADITGAAVRR